MVEWGFAQSLSNHEIVKSLDGIYVNLFTKLKNIGAKEYPWNVIPEVNDGKGKYYTWLME